MKLFHKLLLAPAALGLMAPVAASAADMNLAGVNQYATAEEQVTSISQFSDVQPTDWAYQALSNLVERYGCVAGYPNGTFQGKKAMTRFEAAALLNACLDRVTEVTDQLKKLMKEFEKELAILKGRVDGLEARVGTLEANQFSTTTKLHGSTYWVLGANSFGGNYASSGTFGATPTFAGINGGASASEGATTFNYDLRLDLDTSFTGKDLLRTRLRAGNFGASGFYGGGPVGLNGLEVSFQSPAASNIVAIDRLFYQFPLGSGFTFTGGPRVRQDDMLAMWPSAYPADTILDVFTYAGAPGAYSLNLGGGAGIWWQKNGFSISANYVSANAGNGQPGYNTTAGNGGGGGIMTQAAQSSATVQVGYAGGNWGAAFAYTYGQNGNYMYGGNATPLAAFAFSSGTGTSNNYGLSAYWTPKTSGYIPSISAGWGYTSFDAANTATSVVGASPFSNPTASPTGITAAQNWYVGLQWADAFVKGNSLGMAVGQPTFVTAMNSGTPQDAGYAWEWWYKFQVTDHISVTPAIFYLSNPQGNVGFINAQADGLSTTNPLTNFGGLIKTTFKF
jgi:hypothetical protein